MTLIYERAPFDVLNATVKFEFEFLFTLTPYVFRAQVIAVFRFILIKSEIINPPGQKEGSVPGCIPDWTRRVSQTEQSPSTPTSYKEMAAVFAQAVECLVLERDRQFLQRISVEYSLNFDELQSKYLAVAEVAIKIPRKYKTREAKDVKTTDEAGQATKCQGITAKKEPCKFSALKGGCYCKRHLEKAEGTKAAVPPAPVVPVVPVQDVKAVPPAEETEKRLAAILKEAESEDEDEDEEAESEEDEEHEYSARKRIDSEEEEEYEDEE